jgi:hypothetical protein
MTYTNLYFVKADSRDEALELFLGLNKLNREISELLISHGTPSDYLVKGFFARNLGHTKFCREKGEVWYNHLTPLSLEGGDDTGNGINCYIFELEIIWEEK